MGVDIYFKSGQNEFSCRLYWITNLIDEYGWQYKGKTPDLRMEKKFGQQEIAKLASFLRFCLQRLSYNKKREAVKFDSIYFKKAAAIHQSLKQLVFLLKHKRPIEKELFPKLQGIIRRLEGFVERYDQDPIEQKKEISESFNERIDVVKRTLSVLQKILTEGGLVRIG